MFGIFEPRTRAGAAHFAARLAGFVLAAFLGCGHASAQDWKAYAYPSNSFSIRFPGKPKIDDSTYTTIDGMAAPARIYHLEGDDVEYKMIVADFSGQSWSRQSWSEGVVIAQAIKTLAQAGDVKLNVAYRIRRVYGRQLSVAGADGGHSWIAVFYYRRRLYQIQGTVLASNPDPASAQAIQFQESLQFMNGNARPSSSDPFSELPFANRGAPSLSR